MADDRARVFIPEACGLGRPDDGCCAYLTFGGDSFLCGRDMGIGTTIRKRVAEGRMNAKRLPEEPRPHCQIYGAGF